MADTEQIPGDTENSTVVDDGRVKRPDRPASTETAPADGAAKPAADQDGAWEAAFDRSRARMRLPASIVDDSLRLAHVQSMPPVDGGVPEPELPATIERLEAAGIMTDGVMDEVAHQLLEVVNQASLIVTVRLTYGADASTSTIWATPRQAVMSSTLSDDHVDYMPVPVVQLPQAIAQLIVLQSPRFVGDVLLEIDAELLELVNESRDDVDAAAQLLIEAGLDSDQAILLVDLQRHDVRRWRISSEWSTETGPMSTEMVGVDGASSGQWVITAEQADGEEPMRILYTPQGHGEVMSGFRNILPKNWLGKPLNPPLVLADSE